MASTLLVLLLTTYHLLRTTHRLASTLLVLLRTTYYLLLTYYSQVGDGLAVPVHGAEAGAVLPVPHLDDGRGRARGRGRGRVRVRVRVRVRC